MFLPKQILALKRIVAKAAGRLAYANVRIERTDDGPRAMATDGRRAVVFSWDEPRADQYPPVEGMSPAPAKRYAANVPPRALAEAGRGVAKRTTTQPALAHLRLDESDASMVRVAAANNGSITRAQAKAEEGTFPDCVSVLPVPAREGGVYDPGRHGAAAFSHTRIGVNAKQFAQTLQVVSDLAADDPSNTDVVTVPLDPHRPIRLDARSLGRRAAAAIMPVSADMSAYDEPRRPAPLPAPGAKAKGARKTSRASGKPRKRPGSTRQIPGPTPDPQRAPA